MVKITNLEDILWLSIIFGLSVMFICWCIKRLKKAQKEQGWKFEAKCRHIDELNHDRRACYQREASIIALLFIFLAIAPKH